MDIILAARTKNFSGAEIEGLVKSAVSFALNRQVDVSDLSKPIDEENIKVKFIKHCIPPAHICVRIRGERWSEQGWGI